MLCTFPASLRCGLLERADLCFGVPPCMRRFECQDIPHLQLAQSLSEASILAVKGISHDRAKRYGQVYRTAHQFHTDFEFGAKCWILFAFLKVVSRGVRFEVDGVVDTFIG